MSNVYALIKAGLVVNCIAWGGPEIAPMEFEEGITYEKIPDEEGNNPGPGWYFKDGVFSRPPLTDEEIERNRLWEIESNKRVKESLLAQATLAIAPLQDAVDLDDASEEEVALLKKWKQYRVAVNRIDANTDKEIEWPAQPA